MTGRWMRGLVVDLRSLALFRLALAAVLLVDLLLRLPQLHELYTDAGVLPREAMLLFSRGDMLSVHYLSGAWWYQFLLLLAGILFATGLLVGYRTRLCAALSWLLLLSLHARNPYVLHGGDAVLRLLLLWAIFAPLNARFSLDKALNPDAPVMPASHLSPASLALVFQVCGIYWFAAAEKVHPIWLGEQSAVYYALSLDQFATPLGRRLLEYPSLLRVMTSGTLALELFGPMLALSPILTTPLRLLIPASFIGFHLSLAATMRLDLFPWVCIAAWLAFLPGVVWEHWRRPAWSLPRALMRWKATPPAPLRGVGGILVLFLLLLSTASFTGALPSRRTALGSITDPLVKIMMLDQTWKMFAPYPSPEDGWFVIEGVTGKGRRHDLWNGGVRPTDEKPASFAHVYPNTQWLAYLTGLRRERRREFRPYFGRYLCRGWNDRHSADDRIELVDVGYMIEMTPEPGKPPIRPYPEVVWLQPCP
jgi:hypothetical protein